MTVVAVVVVAVLTDARAPPAASGPVGGLVDGREFGVFLVEVIMSNNGNNEDERITRVRQTVFRRTTCQQNIMSPSLFHNVHIPLPITSINTSHLPIVTKAPKRERFRPKLLPIPLLTLAPRQVRKRIQLTLNIDNSSRGETL